MDLKRSATTYVSVDAVMKAVADEKDPNVTRPDTDIEASVAVAKKEAAKRLQGDDIEMVGEPTVHRSGDVWMVACTFRREWDDTLPPPAPPQGHQAEGGA